MKSRFLFLGVVGLVIAAALFLFKRLLDTEEKLVHSEAQRDKLQREQDAVRESFMEANAHYAKFNAENPLPDDPDRKMRVAMMDAIHSANAREILGKNHVDYHENEEEDES